MRWRYVEAQATALPYDGFAVLDRKRPDIDSNLSGKRQRLVRRERRSRTGNVSRFRLSRASPTTAGTIRLVFAIGSTPARRKRARQLPRLAARHAVTAVGRERRELRLAVSSAAGSESAIEDGSVRALRTVPAAAGEQRRRGLCLVALLASHVPLVHDAALALRLSRRPLRQAAAPLQRAGAARRTPQRLSAQRDRVAHARPGLLRARLVATALRERLSRQQRAVCRLAQLLVAARRRLPTRSRSATACRRARRRFRFTASGRRTRQRPRKCSSTAATSSIRRAARCSTTTRSRSRGRWWAARRFCARAAERADPDVARLDEEHGRRARARMPEHQAQHQTSSTASAAGWRRK